MIEQEKEYFRTVDQSRPKLRKKKSLHSSIDWQFQRMIKNYYETYHRFSLFAISFNSSKVFFVLSYFSKFCLYFSSNLLIFYFLFSLFSAFYFLSASFFSFSSFFWALFYPKHVFSFNILFSSTFFSFLIVLLSPPLQVSSATLKNARGFISLFSYF